MNELEEARAAFAENLRGVSAIRSEALVRAFATVPRESFLGPPPWQIWDPKLAPAAGSAIPYVLSDDPRSLYRDVLVAIDSERGINNGQPSLWAFIYDRLTVDRREHVVHIGCGVGYYTAVLAELVGAEGRVTGLDVDPTLVNRAKTMFSGRSNVQIHERNGADYDNGPADVIVVNAGTTRVLDVWLDALKVGGRLMLPITADGSRPEAGFGAFFLIRRNHDNYGARFICPTGIFHFVGARTSAESDRIKIAFGTRNAELESIASLRRDEHVEDASCWLHGEGYCLSLQSSSTRH